MTLRTNQIVRSYGKGFFCGIATILLVGCIVNPDADDQAATVKVIPENPVHMAVSVHNLREAKKKSITVFVLPNDKLSLAGS